MKKTCQEAVDRLYPYLDGEVSRLHRFRVRWHLRRCAPCDGAFHFEERLKVTVSDGLKDECPDEVIDRLRALLGDERAKG